MYVRTEKADNDPPDGHYTRPAYREAILKQTLRQPALVKLLDLEDWKPTL